MSLHPNTTLAAALTPKGSARETFLSILKANNVEEDDNLKIGELYYLSVVMDDDDDYSEEDQISAKEGDIVFYSDVTYGYGDTISWDALVKHKAALEAWAKEVCEQHHCTYEIFLTATYC